MPRDPNGAYTPPAGNPVASGALVEANWANTTVSDLGNELSDSLSRSGKGNMLASLTLQDGSQSTLALRFAASVTTGFFREGGGGDLVFRVAGVEVFRCNDTPELRAGALFDTGNRVYSASNPPPVAVGDIRVIGVPAAGAAVPPGYLACDGSLVSRTTYAALFAVLGTSWDPGVGATEFRLPPLHASGYAAFVYSGV